MKRRDCVKLGLGALPVFLLAGCSNSEATGGAGASDGDETVGAITAVIQWAEGGGTDSVVRPLLEAADAEFEIQNKPGAAGSIAFHNVLEMPADGSYILCGAENPCLYELLGYGGSYDDYACVCLIGSETVGVVVSADSKYTSFSEIVQDALDGKKVVLSTTNMGGMPWTLSAMVEGITGATFSQQWYSGDAAALQAVLDGDADFTFCKLQIGAEDYAAGTINYLTMIATESAEGFEEVPPVTDEYPEFADYLPWGPFYGIFVNAEASDEVVDELTGIFDDAFETADYQEFLAERYIEPLGLAGNEAASYISDWRDNTVGILSELELKAGSVSSDE